MIETDVSKIPLSVMQTARSAVGKINSIDPDNATPEQIKAWEQNTAVIVAMAILQERADCAQHAFRMRWSPMKEQIGTKNAEVITAITKDWSEKIGFGILNRGEQ